MPRKRNNLNFTNILIVSIVVIGALAAIYMLQGNSVGQTVSATGMYETKVQPDQIVVYLLIQTKDATAQGAKNQNSMITDAVLSSLKDAGIDDNNIETENYNIYPEYNWTSGRQDIIGYVATNNIKITTSDFTNVGKIIDASVDSGALVSYINFELSNEKSNQYKAIALAEASKDAKIKAESIVSGLGKNLGDLVSVSASDFNYYPYPIYTAAESSGTDVKQVATNIQPKSLDISATATVVYKIV